MNRPNILWLGISLGLALSLPCFADEVQGRVGSIDPSNNTIVVQDPVAGTSRTVRVHPKVITGVKNGSVVKAKFKPGSDEADTVQVLVAE